MTTVAIASVRPVIDLTLPQWRVLVILGDASDAVRISDVARRMGVTLPATSRQLRRLERRGLVDVVRSERDRRSSVAQLTPAGESVRAAVIGHRRTLIDELMGPFGSDAATGRALARVAEAMDRGPLGAESGTNGGSRRAPRQRAMTAIDTHQRRSQP